MSSTALPPPPPPPTPLTEPRTGPPKGQAVASMVLGIVSAASFLVPPLAIVCGTIAIALSIAARRSIRVGAAAGSGQAIAGLICGLVGIILGLLLLPAFIAGWNDA